LIELHIIQHQPRFKPHIPFVHYANRLMLFNHYVLIC
jgi:hypothetical protein